MIKLVKGFRTKFARQAWEKELVLQKINLLAHSYGFSFFQPPLVEDSQLYSKGLGKTSDIVHKQFFATYLAKQKTPSHDWVLRPEFTSAVVRFFLEEQHFSSKLSNSFFSYGECFRYEQPQKGRYRQFSQWNLEQLPANSTNLDQNFAFLAHLLKILTLETKIVLEINYLSPKKLEKISDFFLNSPLVTSLCNLCQTRLTSKRIYQILDCADCQKILPPSLLADTVLSLEEKTDYEKIFTSLKKFFSLVKIKKNLFLTRGLDYYQGFIFEIKFLKTKSQQNTIIAGGYYNLNAFLPSNDVQLVQLSTTNKSPLASFRGFGFAIGIDRLLAYHTPLLESDFFTLQLLIGYTDHQLASASYWLQHQILLSNHTIKTLVVKKPLAFPKLLKYAGKYFTNDNQQDHSHSTTNDFWLLILGKEYLAEEKIVCRKITFSAQEKKPLQILLNKTALTSFLNQYINHE